MGDSGARKRDAAPRWYREPARSYLSSSVLGLLLLVGFLLDLLLGGGRQHLAGWAIALFLVVGIDALTVHAARSLRSITVTDTEVRVGDDVLARAQIIGIERGVTDPSAPILGRTEAEGLPRGAEGVSLRLADGRRIVVPTRRPERLADSLQAQLEVPEVRRPEPAELALLPEIGRRAATLYKVAGMQLPPTVFRTDTQRAAETVFVHGRPPTGFIRVEEIDGQAHIEELAVVPGHMRHGIGSALVEAACAWAASRGFAGITVIAYTEVAWSGPFFTARGFAEVDQLTPELAELRDWERTVGLDELGERVVMRRRLG